MLRSFSVFLRYRGYGGMLILLDELENVLHQPPAARRTAYTLLRELIDNVDDRHGMANTAVYISATPDVFDSSRGLVEYEALAERVILPSGRIANPAGAVIDLAAWPFSRTDYEDIADRIATLYGIAKASAPSLTHTLRTSVLDAQLKKNPELSVRSWVRTVIDELDTARTLASN
jgi:hypothetical protein